MSHHDRLIGAMGELVAEHGYPAVTVTDVVARARVSKRTFYQHFADREDCFLATYTALAEIPLGRIGSVAGDPAVQALPLTEQVALATGAYLDAMGEQPGLTRTLLAEIASVGPRGRSVRREVLHRFAEKIVALVEAARARHPELPPLGRVAALALVGGINELVVDALDTGESVPALAPTVTALVVAVVASGAGTLGA